MKIYDFCTLALFWQCIYIYIINIPQGKLKYICYNNKNNKMFKVAFWDGEIKKKIKNLAELL